MNMKDVKDKLILISPIILIACLLFALPACADSSKQNTEYTSPSVSQPPYSASPSSSEPQPSSPSAQAIPSSALQVQTDNQDESDIPVTVSGEVVITFEYAKQSGSASNQFAVWVEDMDGNLIKTLYTTGYTANGGYINRPDSIALWVEKSSLPNMQKNEVDAITGATPKAGKLSYAWDLSNLDGETIPAGKYMFFVEGTLRWKNFVLYSAAINISDVSDTVQAKAEFFYESSDRYAALTADSPENNMIENVAVSFTPK